MTEEQEKNHQLWTQSPETIYPDRDEFDRPEFTSTDATAEPAKTPTEITEFDGLIPTSLTTDNTDATDDFAKDLTSQSEDNDDDITDFLPPSEGDLITENAGSYPEIKSIDFPTETTAIEGNLTPEISEITADIPEEYTFRENLAEINEIEGDLTPTPAAIEEQPTLFALQDSAENYQVENDFTPTPAENSPEISPLEDELTTTESPATTIQETGVMIVETPPEIPPADIRRFFPEATTETDSIVTNQNVNPAPKSPKIWQLLLIFFSGMLVGSVISLGTLLAWRMYQERANLQIRLSADVPLPPSPSPVATTPARQFPGIPPAPGTASPLSANIPSPIPSPNPTQVPSLSGVPQLASPAPLPSPPAAGLPSPFPSPSPAAETAVTDRVNFEAGATGTTLTNTLPDNKSKRYLIDCQGGQTMTLSVPEGAVSATIIAPNGAKIGTANNTTPWEGQLPSSGDYTIEISGESQANYGVKIEVK